MLYEKEKLVVTSNFSFSHSHFKRLVLQTYVVCLKKGLMVLKKKPKRTCVSLDYMLMIAFESKTNTVHSK